MKAPAAALDGHMEWFIEDYARETLYTLEEDEFRSIVAAEVAKRCERPTNNGDEAGAIWSEITRRSNCRFDRKAQEVGILLELERADLCRFYDETLAASGQRTARLAVQVDSKGSAAEGQGQPETGPQSQVGNMAAFKAAQRFC